MTTLLTCDGCGQPASSEHLSRRLQRLEWATRYRPLHIQSLLLGAIAPAEDAEFLYSEAADLSGEAAHLLDALQIPREGKSPDSLLSDVQKRGLFLMHVLECPVDLPNQSAAETQALLEKHLPAAITRIRRSLKPRRVVLLSRELQPLTARLTETALGCRVLLHLGKPFEIMEKGGMPDVAAFRLAVEGATSAAV
jgi:hypothetical protein